VEYQKRGTVRALAVVAVVVANTWCSEHLHMSITRIRSTDNEGLFRQIKFIMLPHRKSMKPWRKQLV
jgi:hypothetical protein